MGLSCLPKALLCLLLFTSSAAEEPEGNVYSFTVKDIRGKDVKLSDYRGQVRVYSPVDRVHVP